MTPVRWIALATVALALLLALLAIRWTGSEDDSGAAAELAGDDRTFASNDPIQRGCALEKRFLLRIWRGHDPVHSEDVTIVPQYPNYSGAFTITSHSGPWDYLQRVPLVFYGPGRINASREPLRERASITDVYATVGRLLGVRLPRREGDVLIDALAPPAAHPPKLVLVVVWDGVGRNVLERWPGRWPTLARMERRGTSYLDATVGSSPSITPATHSSLGTGSFPRSHGVTAIQYRSDEGEVVYAFARRDPRDLELPTFADVVDRSLGNEPRVGMLGWIPWHLGMLGHGAALPGGDDDELALIKDERVGGNDRFYSTPPYLRKFTGPREEAAELDRADGRADGRWLGNEILKLHDNPAWVSYQTRILLEMLERGGYGRDAVPDLFFTNYKMSDIAGHQYAMDGEETGRVLQAQDKALGRVLEYLDRSVGDYVVVVTADHGHTPSPDATGAWPLLQSSLRQDVDRHFGAPAGGSLVEQTTAAGLFVDRRVARRLKVTPEDVARFLNGYTIEENWPKGRLPRGYEERGEENVLSAAFSKSQLPRVLTCAFGEPRPPADLEG